MKRPFVFIAVSFACGIVFSYFFNFDFTTLKIIFGILILILLFFIKFDKRSLIIIFILLFIAGAFNTYNKLNSSYLLNYVGSQINIRGIIKEVTLSSDEKKRYILDTEEIRIKGQRHLIKERMSLNVVGKNELSPGDEIYFPCDLREVKRNTNPKLFNYKLYMMTRGIYVTTTVRDYNLAETGKGKLNRMEYLSLKFKDKVEDTFQRTLSPSNGNLMKSILLGEYDYLKEDEILKYRELGLAHILAASGQHIGIISFIIIKILAYLGVERKINILITSFIVWMYGMFIGFPPSILRSLIMFSIILYSQMSFRRYDNINTLFFSMLVILGYNPLFLFDIGFQMSFIATLSLFVFTSAIRHKFYPFSRGLLSSLSAISAIQVGIIPVNSYYFNNISLVSILANFILLPLFSLILIGGFFLLIFSFINMNIAVYAGKLLEAVMNVQNCISDVLMEVSPKPFRAFSPNVSEMIIYYFLLLSIFRIIRLDVFDFRIRKAIFFYSLILILFSSILDFTDKSMRVEFIDVGQGDSILLRTNNGNYLIDTGGNIFGDFDVGERVVLPYLVKEGIFNLSGVFITHFDEDHCKSLPLLMENMDIDKIYISHCPEDNKIFNDMSKKAAEKKIPLIELKGGDNIYIDDKIYINVISPKGDLSSRTDKENNFSLVFFLNYYNNKILFTGDIEKEVEELIIEDCTPADYLKVPHHGSMTSSTDEFIKKLSPKYAFICVGQNSYNHPHEVVLERYKELGTKLYRTDEMGLITLEMDRANVSIDYFLKDKMDIWECIIKYEREINFGIIYILLEFIFLKIYVSLEKELKYYEL